MFNLLKFNEYSGRFSSFRTNSGIPNWSQFPEQVSTEVCNGSIECSSLSSCAVTGSSHITRIITGNEKIMYLEANLCTHQNILITCCLSQSTD